MLWFSFVRDTRAVASRVCFVYEGMRQRGTISDTDEWSSYLDEALAEAKEKDAPDDFCWALLIAMGCGGLDLPLEDRPELGDPTQAWSDQQNWKDR